MLFRKALTKLEREDRAFAHNISRIISSSGGLGALRKFREMDSVPVDGDSGMELLVVEQKPDVDVTLTLSPNCQETINRFIKERQHVLEIKSAGIKPPTSLALMGPPGTGKTTLARWIAAELNLPLMALNLASVVTSYLGQTGQNIKKALDRAKVESSVLLLDEFDALGRARIENDDVGEMKRVVAVLLQEVDTWPDHSVLIAATNLPELVDPAFRRRFSRWLWLPLPDESERARILRKHYKGKSISKRYFELAALCLTDSSGADLSSFANKVTTRQILDKVTAIKALWEELVTEISERELSDDLRKRFIKAAREIDKKRFTFRRLAQFFNISHTTAMHLAKAPNKK